MYVVRTRLVVRSRSSSLLVVVVVSNPTTYDDDDDRVVVVVVLRGVFRRVMKTDLYSVVVSAKSGNRVDCFLYVNGEMMKGGHVAVVML